MTESLPTLPKPETLLALKDGILDRWNQLPAEHQASMALVLLGRILEGEYAVWLFDAIETLAENTPHVSIGVARSLLARAHLTREEIDQLDEHDLRGIAQTLVEHYVYDAFWEELEFVARLTLAGKRHA
jgi:hypothetical protein